MVLGIIIVIVIVIVLYFILTYNSLVSLRNKVKDSWAQVDVLLKRRNDLIPNLVETVKGYATHEKSTLDAVIKARNNAVSANTKETEIQAASELTGALSKLFALSEAYPDLKANENFASLQNSLNDTEDKISFAREAYNNTVLTYKNKLEMFPSNLVASMFGFKPEAFFETKEEEKEVPKVSFN